MDPSPLLKPPWETVPDSRSAGEDSDGGLSQELPRLSVRSTRPRVKRPTKPKKVSEKSKAEQTKRVTKPRVKSPGTIAERVFSKDKTYSNVTCRLETVCPDPDLLREIRRSARVLKQVQMEAWHLVNLHTLRCLESGLDLPAYDQTFFDHCCSGVAWTSQSANIAHKNPDLWKTITIYRTERKRAGLEEVTSLTGLSSLKFELRTQMVVNAGVMLREHFRRRLRLFVRVRYPECEDVNAVVRACYNTEPSDLNEVAEIREMLTPDGIDWGEGWIPWPNRITEKGKTAFYVRLLWTFQKAVEARMQEVPNEKGVRAFSLFPASTTYSSAHIKINGTTLAGICARIKDETGVNMAERWGVPDIKLDTKAFQQKRWTVMRKAFCVSKFETLRPDSNVAKHAFAEMSVDEKYAHASHLFANQVTTDGYGASVLLFRSKNEQDKNSPSKQVVPRGYSPDIVIGVDPGMRSVFTAVREDLRPKRVRRRSRRKRGKYRPRRRNGRDIVSVSSKEYRHLAGFRRRRAWEEGLKRQYPEYATIARGMPSFKTAGFETYLSRLEYFWRHFSFLQTFCLERPFLKLKFFQKRQARIAVDALAKRVVPVPSRQTCVAYGDWSRTPGIKGHAPSPVKGLRQALAKRATVVSMDEFRTSKLCSTCRCELSSVSYSVDSSLEKRRKRSGRVVFRERDGTMETRKCHAVLKCENKKCEDGYWDRDVNAAINMVGLLKRLLEGRPRLQPFCRPKKPKSASKTSDGIMGEIVGESSSESADET